MRVMFLALRSLVEMNLAFLFGEIDDVFLRAYLEK